jgi:hypothetical protein
VSLNQVDMGDPCPQFSSGHVGALKAGQSLGLPFENFEGVTRALRRPSIALKPTADGDEQYINRLASLGATPAIMYGFGDQDRFEEQSSPSITGQFGTLYGESVRFDAKLNRSRH